MTHVWNPTIQIDIKLASALIHSQFGLDIFNIITFGEGWDNIAYLVNHHLVFRFPRREIAVSCMENEILILPYLLKQISFPFSCPAYIGQPSERYPYVFTGYPIIPGKMLADFNPQKINNIYTARVLAQWLRELHSIPVLDEHRTALQGEQSWRLDITNRISRCTESLNQYSIYYEKSGFNLIELQDIVYGLERFEFDHINKISYLHGDLYYKHIIADDNLKLTGLIDWGDVHIGSPGIDLSAAIILFEVDVLNAFWEVYQNIDETILRIAAFRAFCHQIALLPYVYEQKDEYSIRWVKIALKRAGDTLIKSA